MEGSGKCHQWVEEGGGRVSPPGDGYCDTR